jgi:hypothetical protein
MLLWEYSYKRLRLARILGQLGVFLLTFRRGDASAIGSRRAIAAFSAPAAAAACRRSLPAAAPAAKGGAVMFIPRPCLSSVEGH